MIASDAYVAVSGLADFLDMYDKDLAELIGVHPVTLSKWRGAPETIAEPTAKLICLLRVRPELVSVLRGNL